MTFILWPTDTSPSSQTVAVAPQGVQSAIQAIDLPFRIDASGRVAVTNDLSQQAVNRVLSIIGTGFYERCERSEYGTALRNSLFENIDALGQAALTAQIGDAITLLETGVIVENINAITTDPAGGSVMLEMTLSIVQTGERRNTVLSVGSVGATPGTVVR